VRCFGRPSTAFVNVVQNDIDEEISKVVNTSPLDSQAAQIFSQAVPAVELAKVHIIDLERSDIFKGKERHGSVKRKLFISCNETSLVVWCEPQTRDLGKGRVQVPEIFLEYRFLFLCSGSAVGPNAERRPEGRHARHDTTNTGHGVDRVAVGVLGLGPLGVAEE
jgi:hypothetical protein